MKVSFDARRRILAMANGDIDNILKYPEFHNNEAWRIGKAIMLSDRIIEEVEHDLTRQKTQEKVIS